LILDAMWRQALSSISFCCKLAWPLLKPLHAIGDQVLVVADLKNESVNALYPWVNLSFMMAPV
jgi:hypothetical protein